MPITASRLTPTSYWAVEPRDSGDMLAILDVLDEARAAGTVAYVHCWGGTGRTGTVVGCLYRRGGASGGEALAEVMRRWSTMEKAPHRPWGSPENDLQRRYVRDRIDRERRDPTDSAPHDSRDPAS